MCCGEDVAIIVPINVFILMVSHVPHWGVMIYHASALPPNKLPLCSACNLLLWSCVSEGSFRVDFTKEVQKMDMWGGSFRTSRYDSQAAIQTLII